MINLFSGPCPHCGEWEECAIAEIYEHYYYCEDCECEWSNEEGNECVLCPDPPTSSEACAECMESSLYDGSSPVSREQIPAEAPEGSELHVLYRFYDVDDALLYIGVTNNPWSRIKAHGRSKSWWHRVSHAKMEHFPDRESLLLAERKAIRREHPQYNIVHRVGSA